MQRHIHRHAVRTEERRHGVYVQAIRLLGLVPAQISPAVAVTSERRRETLRRTAPRSPARQIRRHA